MIIELIWMPARALRGKGTAFIIAHLRLRSRGLSQGIAHEAPFLTGEFDRYSYAPACFRILGRASPRIE